MLGLPSVVPPDDPTKQFEIGSPIQWHIFADMLKTGLFSPSNDGVKCTQLVSTQPTNATQLSTTASFHPCPSSTFNQAKQEMALQSRKPSELIILADQ